MTGQEDIAAAALARVADLERQLAEALRWRDGEARSASTREEGLRKALAAERAAREAAEAKLAKVVEAAKPFRPGDWGRVKAWIVAGAPTRDEGLEAARQMTNKQAALDVALAAAQADASQEKEQGPLGHMFVQCNYAVTSRGECDMPGMCHYEPRPRRCGQPESAHREQPE